jgi:hypothetical protein
VQNYEEITKNQRTKGFISIICTTFAVIWQKKEQKERL